MGQKIPLMFPGGGLSADSAFSDQTPDTTRIARNVRLLDPPTGMARGGQGPGLSKFLSVALVPGSKVQALGSISRDLPKVNWTELTETDNGETSPGLITPAWSRLTPGEFSTDAGATAEVVWDEMDSKGNVYALEAGGTIQVYNSANVHLKAIPVPVEDTGAILRRLWIDEQDRIYVAASSEEGDVGGKVWQWKLLNEEENLYALRWTLDLEGTPQNMHVRLGVLAVAMDFEEGGSFSRIRTFQNLHTGSPTMILNKGCPNPVRGIHIDKAGNLFTTHPSNSQRGETPGNEGFVESGSKDHFTPHDIGLEAGGSPADNADNARYRLHSMLLSDQMEDVADGDLVSVMKDMRWIWTTQRNPPGNQPGGETANPTEYPDVDDDLANRLIKTFPNPSRRPGPRFRISGAGPNPSLHFNGSRTQPLPSPDDPDPDPMQKPGMALRSFANVYSTFKSDTGSDDVPDKDGTNVAQRALIPGNNTGNASAEGWGNSWVVCQVWRIPEQDNPEIQVLFTQNGDVCKYALLANASIVEGVVVPKTDSIVFISNKMRDAEEITNWPGGPWYGADANILAKAAHETAPDTGPLDNNPARMVLITIGHAGWDWDGGDNPRGNDSTFVSRSFLRINGMARKAFTMKKMASKGDRSFTVLGNPHWKERPHPSDLFGPNNNTDKQPFKVYPFTGEFCGHVCVLGAETSVANDTPVTRPGLGPSGDIGAIPTNGDASGTTNPAGTPPTHAQTQATTVTEQLEGFMAHHFAFPHVLPNDHTDSDTGTGGLFDNHPFGSAADYPRGYGGLGTLDPPNANDLALQSTRPILAKWGSNAGALRWAFNGSGIGNSVITDSDRGVFTTGEKDASDTDGADQTPGPGNVSDDNAIARKTIDLGTGYSEDDADGAWAVVDNDNNAPNYEFPCLRVDGNDDFYWAVGSSRQLRKFNSTSTTADLDGHANQEGERLWTYKVPAAGYKLRSVALDPNVPVYDDTDIKGPPFVYVGSTGDAAENNSGTEVNTLVKLEVVASTQVIGENASPRETKYYGVSNGDFLTYVRGGSSVSTPTGGTGVFQSDSPYVQLVTVFGKVYGVDGYGPIRVYSPLDDEIKELEAEDAGEVPKRAKLITAWNGRLVAARTSDSDSTWLMSAMGGPTKWDYFPSVFRETDAVAGTSNRGPGAVPSIINTLMPATNDLLLVGCDDAVYRFSGNPLTPGASIDLVSDKTGIAFGSPWTKDRKGNIYAFGSLGSVWRFGLDGTASRISRAVRRGAPDVERLLQDINLRSYAISLEWSWEEEGLYVFQLPFGSGGVLVPAWFWESQNGGWFERTWTSTALQPTASATFDGDDPQDRVTVIGCEDGFVRVIDRNAVDDDGSRIDSRVLIGPIAPDELRREFLFSRLQVVLASDQSGCRFRWYAHHTPDVDIELLEPVGEGVLEPGLNPVDFTRARGLYVWLELYNAENTRWAFESATIDAAVAGGAVVGA